MADVEWLERNFHEHAQRKSGCSLIACINEAWKSFAYQVRGKVASDEVLGFAIVVT